MQLETVKKDILDWCQRFVEVPHVALGGWPPCPYARQARLAGTVQILLGSDPYYDLKNRSLWGMNNLEVIIYAYDPAQWDYAAFHASIASANTEFLLPKDLIALEDHPADVEDVMGVVMNQGTYALALVQSVSKLNSAAKQIGTKGFYHDWPKDYLQALFQHRQDPRQ